jgi:diguanylate cyclase (GGDEF)-like protein
MIDIDNFKAFNDNYGHDSGDITLCDFATSIEKSLQRDKDLVARFGGEEFVVLLPSSEAENAFSIAEIIRMNIEALDIKHIKSDAGVVTVSIGIAVMKADKLNRIDLFKHSDIALYFAKDNGKNCSYLYTE